VDDVTWGALALTLTLLGAIWTWVAFRRRGVGSGLRALAFTLLPMAAYLTNTLRMFTRIAEAVADWATTLVFDPSVWIGIVLAALSVALFAASRFVRARSPRGGRRSTGPATGASGPPRSAGRRPASGELPASSGRGEPVIDDDMAEIEALLRRRGIE
jgi:hypothetical protein